MLQAIKIFQRNLQIIMNKAFYICSTDAFLCHHHSLQRTKQGNIHSCSAGRFCTITYYAGHLNLCCTQHIIDLLRSQAMEKCDTGSRCRCGCCCTGAGRRHINIFFRSIFHKCIHQQCKGYSTVTIFSTHLAILRGCPRSHNNHQPLVAASGTYHGGVVTAAHTSVCTSSAPH